jgi:UDP-N-acetylglucosamine 3-dehydrogenase
MRVRTCVIGVGRMGANHARCLSEMPEAELLALADADIDRARETAERFGCREYANYVEMLHDEQPDAVILAVPTPLHLPVATQVIAKGCHLLVEKPMADTPENAHQIMEAARGAGVRLAVGHIERFNPAVRRLKQVIQEGTLGDILSISARRVGLPSPHHGQTNVVVDLAVHDLDVIRFLLDARPQVVSSVVGRLYDGVAEDHADILLLAGEVPCVIQVNWVTPVKVRTLSVVGSAGYAELNYITQRLELFERQGLHPSPLYTELVEKYAEPSRTTMYEGGGEEPLKAELRAFFDSITEGFDPEAGGDDGIIAVELADEVLMSAIRVGEEPASAPRRVVKTVPGGAEIEALPGHVS